jgi:hypothetical protein
LSTPIPHAVGAGCKIGLGLPRDRIPALPSSVNQLPRLNRMSSTAEMASRFPPSAFALSLTADGANIANGKPGLALWGRVTGEVAEDRDESKVLHQDVLLKSIFHLENTEPQSLATALGPKIRPTR